MFSDRKLYAVACAGALAGALSSCASRDDLIAMRQPPLPPLTVAKAVPDRALYRNVVVQQVTGAPEFRWFDGGAALTTRPTRVQVVRAMTRKLAGADMLAPDALDADYLLNIDFAELHGPNVWIASDKLASAAMTFTLIDRRTGRVVSQTPVETSYRARWIGITPEEVRAAIAGPIGVTKDSAIAPVGGAISGVLLGYYLNDDLVMQIADAPIAGLYGAKQAAETGGPDVSDAGFAASFSAALAVGTARGHFSDLEAALAGGLISASGAAAGPEAFQRRATGDGEVSGRGGAARRFAATSGLMELLFDHFASSLAQQGFVQVKNAVSCRSLNPHGYRFAYMAESPDSYALDCPGAHFNAPVDDAPAAARAPFAWGSRSG